MPEDSDLFKQFKYYHISCIQKESILLIPEGKDKFYFFGIGKVFKVLKGEEYDLVFVEFKPTTNENYKSIRTIIVKNNHPRRQILTLKRGQFAMFYGRAYLVLQEPKKPDGTTAKYKKWQLYANALQGWHTPTMFDIKRMEKDNELDEYELMSDKQKDLFDNILDRLADINKENNDE